LNPRSLTTDDFVRLALYKWEPISSQWIVAGTDCSPIANVTIRHINTFSISSNICSPGQYNLFYSEAPVNIGITDADKSRPVSGTTGEGGFQPAPPVQPTFTKDKYNPSQPVLHANSATTRSLSVVLLLIAFIAGLTF